MAKSKCDCGECRECERRAYRKEWYRQNADRLREKQKLYDQAHPDTRSARPVDPEKRKARNAVRYLKRPDRCSRCNTTGPVDGHHEDYSKPTDVIWLCETCHGKEHRTL